MKIVHHNDMRCQTCKYGFGNVGSIDVQQIDEEEET